MKMAAYCRVSTSSEAQLNSLENQKKFFEEYAKKCGGELVKIYADEGISGKKMLNRNAFLELLRDSDQNMFDVVLTKDISRFARNTADFLVGIRHLKSQGTDVRFLSNNQTLLGDSEFVLTLFAALAQQESENLSKRVIFGKKQSAKNGRTPTYIYGYDKTGTYTLKINQSEADTIRLIFELYTSLGLGSRKIADFLNNRSIPTKKRGTWTSKTIMRILKNPIYTGVLLNNKSQTDNFLSGTRRNLPFSEWNTHMRENFRIIDDNVFKKASDIMKKRNKTMRYSNSNSLFYSLAICAQCKSKLIQSENTLTCPICKRQTDFLALKKSIFDFLNGFIHISSDETDFSKAIISRDKKRKSAVLNLYKNGFISFDDMKKQIDEIYDEEIKIKEIKIQSFEFSNKDLCEITEKIEIGDEVKVYFKEETRS